MVGAGPFKYGRAVTFTQSGRALGKISPKRGLQAFQVQVWDFTAATRNSASAHALEIIGYAASAQSPDAF